MADAAGGSAAEPQAEPTAEPHPLGGNAKEASDKTPGAKPVRPPSGRSTGRPRPNSGGSNGKDIHDVPKDAESLGPADPPETPGDSRFLVESPEDTPIHHHFSVESTPLPDEASMLYSVGDDNSATGAALVASMLDARLTELELDARVEAALSNLGITKEGIEAMVQQQVAEQIEKKGAIQQHIDKQAKALDELRSAMEEARKTLVTEERLEAAMGRHRDSMTPDALKEAMAEQKTLIVNEQGMRAALAEMQADLVSEARLLSALEEHRSSTEARLQAALAELHSKSRELPGVVSEERLATALQEHRSDLICEKALRVAFEEQTAPLVSEDRVKELIQSAIAGQPPQTASTRPCTSETAVLSGAQAKSVWSATKYDAVAYAPDNDEGAMLAHHNLEVGMVQHAMNVMPKHSVDEIVIRDVVNSVVRDIVGTFEGLLDRLLMEKKHGTVRNIVAELMTEDVGRTIATGHEQLKIKEFGNILNDLSKLRAEVTEMETRWDDRFGVHDVLKEGQAKLEATADERHRDLDARVAVTETDYVRRSQLDERMQAMTEEFHDLRTFIQENRTGIARDRKHFEEFEAFARSNFAFGSAIEAVDAKHEKAFGDLRERTDGGLKELRETCATKAQVSEFQAACDSHLGTLDKQQSETKSGLDGLVARFEQEQLDARELFATKVELEGTSQRLTAEKDALERNLTQSLRDLDAKAAEKVVLDRFREEVTQSTDKINSQLTSHDGSLEELEQHVSSIQGLCDNTLATKEYAMGVAVEQARKAANEADDTQEIAQLRREFEEERERLRLQVRQQQTTRKDLNDVQETLHGVKRSATDSLKQCSEMEDMVKGAVDKEAEARKKERTEFVELRHKHTTLEELVKSLRDEFSSHVAMQKSQDEKLRDHSTRRYMEQIDRALALHKTVGDLEQGHRELKDTVVKLPRVS